MANVIHIYHSREHNCAHIFATKELNSTVIVPPSVLYLCPTCKKTHPFFRHAGYLVSTPSQLKSFAVFAKKLGVVEYEITFDQ